MFNDCRSKRVVFVAHCVLNQNSISDGTAIYPGAIFEILELFYSAQVGVIQMACPELMCLGLDRGNVDGCNYPVVEENTRIRSCMSHDLMSLKIDELVKNIVHQIIEYDKHNFQILGIIGINRSPSCGVETTSDNNQEIEGEGLFINSLIKSLKEHHLSINIIGIKPSDMESTIFAIKELLLLD